MNKTTQLLILILFSLLLSGCGGGGGRYYPMQTAVNTIGIEKTPFQMKHCFVSLHNMKHSAYAPYDLSSIALRATDDEKMKNESYVCKYSLSMLHYSAERKILMEKTSNNLVDLSVAFAVEILNLVKYLKEQRETIICNQIGRAFIKRHF